MATAVATAAASRAAASMNPSTGVARPGSSPGDAERFD